LELAAARQAGGSVLAEHRMALDALHLALVEAESRYGDVVAAVRDGLPGPTRKDRQALRRYRADGPPSEKVGLEPFAPPEALGQGVTIGETRR
jgi:nitrate reductase delta subunit